MTEWITGGVLALTSLGAVWYDVREHRIPNAVTITAFGVALALRALTGFPALGEGLLGAVLCFLLALPFFLAGGLGGGDVKLLAAFGALLGPARLVTALTVMALVGGVLALVTMARQGAIRSTFHNLGFMLGAVGNRTVSGWRRRHLGSWMRLDTPGAVTVPYGVAISAGALYAWFF